MRVASIAALTCLVLTLGAARAADDLGWKPLFDGKTLDGWEHVGPGKMVVENGLIRTVGGMGLLWYTRAPLGDCKIRVVYKTTSRFSNSGVFIRIADKPKDEWYAVHHGYEVQIDDAADPFHRTGAVYSMAKATAAAGKVGEWNTMEITLKGQQILVLVNGASVLDLNPETATIPPRTKQWEPQRGPRPTKGYIGLQNHDDVGRSAEVYFKEVAVRPLEPAK
jgi:Domain of Unknown Function (DUF1080)